MTSEVIPQKTKKLCLHIPFHQNRFINECARKEKAKIMKLQKDGVFIGEI